MNPAIRLHILSARKPDCLKDIPSWAGRSIPQWPLQWSTAEPAKGKAEKHKLKQPNNRSEYYANIFHTMDSSQLLAKRLLLESFLVFSTA
jgi:hypothetical protein